jgi:hypothetical protein
MRFFEKNSEVNDVYTYAIFSKQIVVEATTHSIIFLAISYFSIYLWIAGEDRRADSKSSSELNQCIFYLRKSSENLYPFYINLLSL